MDLQKFFKKDIVDRNYLITSDRVYSGAFGAPLFGCTFSIEELHKYISKKLLICVFLASITSDFVGRRILGVQQLSIYKISARYSPLLLIFLI